MRFFYEPPCVIDDDWFSFETTTHEPRYNELGALKNVPIFVFVDKTEVSDDSSVVRFFWEPSCVIDDDD